MRRFGLANAANVHREYRKALARQLLEYAKLHPLLFLSRFVNVEHGRGIAFRLFRHKDPGGYVNARLGNEFHFLDVITLARRRDDMPGSQRIAVSADLQELGDFRAERGAVRLELGVSGGELARGRKARLRFQHPRENRVALLRVAKRSVGCAVQGFIGFWLVLGLECGAATIIKPPAEPIGSREAELHRHGVRVGSLYCRESVCRIQQPVSPLDVLRRFVELRRIVLDRREQRPRGDGHMQVAEVDTVDRGGKEVLLHVARPDGSLRPDLEGPTMTRSSLVHRGALDALVQSTDEERKGSSAGLAGASEATMRMK